MAKIKVSTVAEILKKNKLEPALLRQVVEEMNQAVQPEGAEKPPAVKTQVVIVISDPEGLMPKTDFVGWSLKIPESESPATTIDRINKAAYTYNASKRGRLLPVKTHGEALEVVPKKMLKEADLWVLTRTPVLVIRTHNQIPVE